MTPPGSLRGGGGGGSGCASAPQVQDGAPKAANPRVVCWKSCGVTSAVATKLALRKYLATHEVVIARIVIDNEHPDNDRFSEECERWYGQPIARLRSDEYRDCWDVWESRRYIAGIKGAPCTTYLKKAVREAFQRPDDIQVFGFDASEATRAADFRARNFEIKLETPLIEANLSKNDCHALIAAAGIEIPAMYRLGFNNNNCIGCPKGGAGYWNRIRIHFPETFERMAALEQSLGAKLIKLGGKHISLRDLAPDAGRKAKEPRIECDLLCQAFSESLEAA